MERSLQRRTGIAAARLLLLVTPLKIGAGAESAAGAGQHEAAHVCAPVVDLVQRFGKPAQHVDRHRIHDFLVVEPEDRDRSIEIQRDELAFLRHENHVVFLRVQQSDVARDFFCLGLLLLLSLFRLLFLSKNRSCNRSRQQDSQSSGHS